MSNKILALAVGAASLFAVAGAGTASAYTPLPPSPCRGCPATPTFYNPQALMTHQQVRWVLRNAGYHQIRDIHYENYYVVRSTHRGRPSFAVYRGPAYVATAVSPNGYRFTVAVNPHNQAIVGRTVVR